MCLLGKLKKQYWNSRYSKKRHFPPKFNIYSFIDRILMILKIEFIYNKNGRNGGRTTATTENCYILLNF